MHWLQDKKHTSTHTQARWRDRKDGESLLPLNVRLFIKKKKKKKNPHPNKQTNKKRSRILARKRKQDSGTEMIWGRDRI